MRGKAHHFGMQLIKHSALGCRERGILISIELWERITTDMLAPKRKMVSRGQGACSPAEKILKN